jgi:hypothetical protein
MTAVLPGAAEAFVSANIHPASGQRAKSLKSFLCADYRILSQGEVKLQAGWNLINMGCVFAGVHLSQVCITGHPISNATTLLLTLVSIQRQKRLILAITYYSKFNLLPSILYSDPLPLLPPDTSLVSVPAVPAETLQEQPPRPL